MSVRRLHEDEKALIEKMVRGLPAENTIIHSIQDALVEDMNDGGMGSIRFCNAKGKRRAFGREIAEATFKDADGVVVSAAINVDRDGELFELDVWKTDNSPLIRYPLPDEVEVIRRG